ncbi:hypothetical protein AQUCO_06300009v1 [Aquilegia coerulea]|uniref:DUF4408 domain-containing protein n=1 Tax=Aquilegia coerulea TaxID=218851 RepID=A0A2G5CCM4_AQUCA|nr:hypothetical protein AQUCO_06300009v1 [Aquilegia coerulea]
MGPKHQLTRDGHFAKQFTPSPLSLSNSFFSLLIPSSSLLSETTSKVGVTMALLVSKNPIHSIFSIKNLLLSISVVFISLILKLYVPIVFDIIVSGVPMLWTTLRSWFTPPYLYVIVNFIIIAIAASSRFQHKIDEGAVATEMVASEKVQRDVQKEVSSDVSRKNSFEVIEPEIYGYLDGREMGVKTLKKPKELEVKTRKKPVASRSEFQAPVNMYADVDVKVESKLKFQGKEYIESRVLEVRTKKKPIESLLEFEVMKPKKYGQMGANNLVMENKRETSAKEDEDRYSQSKSTEMPVRTNTIEIPIDHSFSDGNSLVFDRLGPQELDEDTPQAGRDVRATEAEANDTLEGTWKMIMESSRIHNAGLQEASNQVQQFKKSNNLTSQSRKKQDTFN